MTRNKNWAVAGSAVAAAALTLAATPSTAKSAADVGGQTRLTLDPAVSFAMGAALMDSSEEQSTRARAERLGISVELASAYMAAKEAAKATVEASLDKNFVVLWPEYTPGGVNIEYMSTAPTPPTAIMDALRRIPHISARFVQVPFTIDELSSAGLRSSPVLDRAADSTLSIKDGTVVFITEEVVEPELAKRVEASALPAGITWRVGPLSRPEVGGGGAMTTCTGGFTVRNTTSNNTGIATAGHCPESQSYAGYSLSTYGQAWSGNADLQWMDGAGFDGSPSVYLGSSPNWPVHHRKNWDNVGITDDVCRYGKVTAGCAEIRDKWFRPNDATVPGATYSFGVIGGVDAQQGDSGGPYYYGNTAWGIHGGDTGEGTNWFTPIDRLPTRLGVQVMIQ